MHIHKNIFRIDIRWTLRSVSLLAFLAVFPNVLGLFHTSVFGVRVHFFQYLVFIAALIYGPIGGVVAGGFGSLFTAVALNNPYIIVGNIILGGLFGLFVRLKWNIILAVLVAYLIQMPWLFFTDVYLVGMPVNVVNGIVVGLLISDLIWATMAGLSYKKIKNSI